MEKNSPRYTLATLADLLGGSAEGPLDTPLDRPVPAGDGDPFGVTFAENESYLAAAEESRVGAVIVSHESRSSGKALIRVESPRAAFGKLLALSQKPMAVEKGIHANAVVSPEATVHPTASVGPFAVVEKGARIGANARIFPFSYVGEDCSVGEGCTLYPHVTLYRDVTVGAGTILHSGVVLGADGFGFIWDGQKRMKVPQVGTVEIGDDVEIGANSTVDRATAGKTSVGSGTKIDNLVQIGHNVQIGEHGVIAAQSGISGSTEIGDRVVMGGNVGTNDHVSITDDVFLGGRSSVDRDIQEPGAYFGTPARPASEAKRSMLLYTRLPELISRIRALEKKIEEFIEKQ